MIRRGVLRSLGALSVAPALSGLSSLPALSSLSSLSVLTVSLASQAAGAAEEPASLWRRLKAEPCIVLVRHANAPGVGDPEGFTLGRCETQRNLDAGGRQQARALGQAFKRQGVRPAAVWASQWCRCQDTASEAFGPGTVPQPPFNSFFAEREQSAAQSEAARQLLLAWRGPGVLVVVTHQVNITALTGIFPASGEAVVLLRMGAALQTLGRLTPAPVA
jgi:phosphohistidine phosphatase SixA